MKRRILRNIFTIVCKDSLLFCVTTAQNTIRAKYFFSQGYLVFKFRYLTVITTQDALGKYFPIRIIDCLFHPRLKASFRYDAKRCLEL